MQHKKLLSLSAAVVLLCSLWWLPWMVRIHSGPSPAIVLHRPVVTDETGARALTTIYQNTCGRPLLCIVSLGCSTVNVNEVAYANATVGATTPPPTGVAVTGISNLGPARRMFFCLVFVVPNNHYYQVFTTTTGAATVTLQSWIEVQL